MRHQQANFRTIIIRLVFYAGCVVFSLFIWGLLLEILFGIL